MHINIATVNIRVKCEVGLTVTDNCYSTVVRTVQYCSVMSFRSQISVILSVIFHPLSVVRIQYN